MPIISNTAEEGNLLPTSALVFGAGASGKSTVIATRINAVHTDAKVLWLTLDNTAVFEDNPSYVDRWDIGVFKDYSAFNKAAQNAILKPQHDVIVVDGVSALHRLAVGEIAKGAQPTIAEWGQMSKTVHNLLRSLKDASTHFYASVLLKTDNVAAQGAAPQYVTTFDLNADLIKRIIPEFNRKMYSFVQPKFNDQNVVIGQEYVVQHNPAAALRFSQLQLS